MGKEEGKDEKRKDQKYYECFLTTFLLLQIILLFLYKSFIVDIAKKKREKPGGKYTANLS